MYNHDQISIKVTFSMYAVTESSFVKIHTCKFRKFTYKKRKESHLI